MIKNILKEGFALKNKGHYKHAIEIFYKALEEDNNSIELLLEIADSFFRLNHEEKALSYIEQILEQDPKHIPTLKLMKEIFLKRNALNEAEQTAKNIYCISNNPKDLVEIFKLLNKQCKYDELFEYKISETNAEIEYEQAIALFKKKQFDKSLKIVLKILDEKPNNQNLLLLLGQIYFAQNKKDECIKLLDKLVENENNPDLLNYRGQLEGYQGNFKQAIQSIQKAIKIDPQNDTYYFNLANIYFKQGETSIAKKYYNLAISLNPNNRNYHFALANLYYSEKHYKRALEELQENFFEANLLKAIILYDTGYLALAKKELNYLLKEQPENQIILDYTKKIDNELGIN